MSTSLIELKNLCFAYRPGEPVLKDISFTIEPGEALGVIGPNGGGKSTLLKILVGLLTPTHGEISFKGRPIKYMGDIDRGCIGYVPQYTKLNQLMPLSVWDLVELGKFNLRPSSKQISQSIELVGLKGLERELVHSLSGGQQQRALVARAVLGDPELLILDEPTKGLDGLGQDQLITLLNELRDRNTALVVVDHNLNQVIKHSSKVICLNKTSHWHNKKELLTKTVLESIYHCEFEHLLIHESGGQMDDHHACQIHEHPPGEDHDK